MSRSAVQHRTVEHEPSAVVRWLLAAGAVVIVGAAAVAVDGGGSTPAERRPTAVSATPPAATPWGFSGVEAGAAGDVAAAAGQGWTGRVWIWPGGDALAALTPAKRLAGNTGLVAGATGLEVAIPAGT